MEKNEQYLNELKEIRQMMEQSSRFLSLSGLSGILIGIYALVGAYLAATVLAHNRFPWGTELAADQNVSVLFVLALAILTVSLFTVMILTYRKTRKAGQKIWGKGTRLMMVNLSVPLATGGIFAAILFERGWFEILAPTMLVFYGLSLVNAAKFTRQEIYYMGLSQVVTGILALVLTNYQVILWAFGFGILHIFYGTIMHFRYDQPTKK